MKLCADNVDGTILFLSVASKGDMVGYFSMWSERCSRGSSQDLMAFLNVAVRIVLGVRGCRRSISSAWMGLYRTGVMRDCVRFASSWQQEIYELFSFFHLTARSHLCQPSASRETITKNFSPTSAHLRYCHSCHQLRYPFPICLVLKRVIDSIFLSDSNLSEYHYNG